ncbi:MAG: glycosyltransferase family 4 protein [Gammaproteobacteria bacterium]
MDNLERSSKILHIITGLNSGGAEAALYRLCSFDRQNVHIVISLTDRGKYGDLLEDAGIVVYSLDMPNGRLSWQGVCKLWRLVREIKPDVVQTWMYHADLIGGIVAKIAGTRAICWGVRHSDVHPVKTKLSTRLVVQLCAKISRWLPSRIVCCAFKALQVHQQLGYPAEKCVVIQNGYDLSRFRPDETARYRLRNEFGIADDMPLLGMVARFDPQKDHLNLIKALAILKNQRVDFRCVLVGNGLTEANRDLSRFIREHELSEKMILLGPRNDISAVMNALDIHILSSAYGEAFPNVLAEAMSCGTPCITTDVGDASLIVADTGWVVPTQNEHALAAAINEGMTLKNNRAEWLVRQQKCRNRIVDNFSIEKAVQSYQQVWSDCQSP